MLRKSFIIAAAAGLALTGLTVTTAALASEDGIHMKQVDWSFNGPFGKFDQGQLQRGYKVYREVCAQCHSMSLLSFRNLGEKSGPFYDEHYPNPNDNPFVKAIAADHQVNDIDSDTGDVIKRPGVTADRFPAPFANEAASRASNGGAYPPDLSVITKARHGGADYIYSLMTGYTATPADMTMPEGKHYNAAMSGNVIAMKAPLEAGKVSFDDGTPATLDNQAKSVAAFLTWASEPKQTERKQAGLAVMIYLILLAGLVYASYRRVWRNESH